VNQVDGKRGAIFVATVVFTCFGAFVTLIMHRWEVMALLALIALVCAAYLGFSISNEKKPSQQAKPRNKSKAAVLAEVYRATTEALACAIAAKDCYEQHHVCRVRKICMLIAEKMGLSSDNQDALSIAALVHDVGKLGVPEYILLKPGPLDPDEFAKIANHANVGAKILERVDYPWDIANIVRHHHERYDGTGYPDHLVGDQIPLESRIIAVAEVYDALVSDRCYRPGWSHRRAVEHIEKLSGSHFDPRVVSALLEVEAEIASTICSDEMHPLKSDDASSDNSCEVADLIAQANRELVSLFEIAETLSSTLELDEVLTLLAHKTRRLVEAAACAVLLLDESAPNTLVVRAAVGMHQEVLKGARARFGKGVTGKTLSRVKPFVGSYDPNDLSLALDFKSCMVIPIVNLGRILGTINLYECHAHAFSSDDIRTLMPVANRAAVAIQNAIAFENLRDSAMKDPITGLYNARYLRSYLERELNRASRQCETVTVLGIDLDNFKAVNDTFGHFKGDVVLKDVADILRRQLRDYDVAVRNGGDEFVVVLPGTTAQEAIHTVERIRREFDRYVHRAFGKTSVKIGVSIGMASYPNDAHDPESLLAVADAAMYRDKRSHKQAKAA
jgi:diguanylate cyclase (GGDEF)-like protein/putative nucleotidyltransferase with HDIG domain